MLQVNSQLHFMHKPLDLVISELIKVRAVDYLSAFLRSDTRGQHDLQSKETKSLTGRSKKWGNKNSRCWNENFWLASSCLRDLFNAIFFRVLCALFSEMSIVSSFCGTATLKYTPITTIITILITWTLIKPNYDFGSTLRRRRFKCLNLLFLSLLRMCLYYVVWEVEKIFFYYSMSQLNGSIGI